MSQFLSFLPWLLGGAVISLLFVFKAYFVVNPRLIRAFENKDVTGLQGYFLDENENWFQRSKALEFISALDCTEQFHFLKLESIWKDTSFRLALLQGCQRTDYENHRWIYPILLRDGYSYIKLISLERIQKERRHEEYASQLESLIKDSSTMVARLASKMSIELQQMKGQ